MQVLEAGVCPGFLWAVACPSVSLCKVVPVEAPALV
jgi:hypothetical protein